MIIKGFNITLIIAHILMLCLNSSNASDTNSYSNFSTSILPIIHLNPIDNLLYDYIVQLGESSETLALRLDLIQGDVWVPASTAFQDCNCSSISYPMTTLDLGYTPSLTVGASTYVITSSSTFTITSPSSTLTSTLSTINTEIEVNMVESVFYQQCASEGMYNLLNTVYASFYNIVSNLKVSFENASQYSQIFVNGIFVSGYWVVDKMTLNFAINGHSELVEFEDFPFVYSNFSDVGVGALALGSASNANLYENNFISNFVSNDLINSNSYSLCLGCGRGRDPLLVLGGVLPDLIFKDTSGSTSNANTDLLMALFDFVPVYDPSKTMIKNPDSDGLTDTIPAFPIFGWGVTSNASGESVVFSNSYNDIMEVSNYPKAAIIDTRHFYNYIPYSTLVDLAVELEAYYSSDMDRWVVDCTIGSAGTIDIFLGGNYTINMPISQLLMPAIFNDTQLSFTSGNDACFLAFLPDYYLGYSLMGTPFLKNVYLAVDNENMQLAISPLTGELSQLGININDITGTEIQENVVVSKTSEMDTTLSTIYISVNEEKEVEFSTVSTSTFSTETNQRSYSILGTKDTTIEIEVPDATLITKSSKTTFSLFTSTITDNQLASVTTQGDFYEIDSGVIPFAKQFTSVSGMTITIPTAITYTNMLRQSTEAYISDGEVYVHTGDNGRTTHGKSDGNSGHHTSTATILAFNTLVTSVSSSGNSMKAAGNNLKVPVFFQLGGSDWHSLRLAGSFLAFVLTVALLL